MDDIMPQITQITTLKVILSALFGVFVYLLGEKNLSPFYAVLALGVLDTLTAIYVCYKNNKPILSKKLPRKLIMLTVYAIVIMTMNLLTKVNSDFSLTVDLAVGWAAVSEGLSVLEHLAALGFKIPIPILNNLKKNKYE